MALNLGFNGFVYDHDNNPVDCKFQAHFVRQGTWNSIRSTASQYFSCNAGDGDALTQEGEVKTNDVILLAFWVGDGSNGSTSDSRDTLFDEFGVVAITHDGVSSAYNFNVQLQPKTPPVISWTHPTVWTINNTITLTNNSSDSHNWSYEGKTFHHRRTYYGVNVFNKVDVLDSLYNWGEGEADTTSTNNIYENIGVYTTHIETTNQWGLSSEDDSSVTIKYNTPTLGSYFTPNGVNPVVRTTGSSVAISTITDIDNRITNIDYSCIVRNRDNYAEISNTVIDTNTIIDYEYDVNIELLQRHFAKQTVYWNDGFDDLIISGENELPITNWKPEVDFSIVEQDSLLVDFIPLATDLDGVIVEYRWKIYSEIPFQDGTYTLAKEEVVTTSDTLHVTFSSMGNYRAELAVIDDYGDSSVVYKDFTLEGTPCSDSVEEVQVIRFDWE